MKNWTYETPVEQIEFTEKNMDKIIMANEHISVGDLTKEERDNINNVQQQAIIGKEVMYLKNYMSDLFSSAKGIPFKRDKPKIGRNQPCPCGKNKKYKHCCGNK